MLRWHYPDVLPLQDSDENPALFTAPASAFSDDDWMQPDWDSNNLQEPGRESPPGMTGHELLTREQEIALASALDNAFQVLAQALDAAPNTHDRDALLELAQRAARNRHLPPAHRHNIARALQRVVAIRNQLVMSNIRLVYFAARRFMEKGMELDDMVQEGILGLLRATLKFDGTVGVRFSTYAYWWIQQAIRQAIAKQRSLIRYPANVNVQVNRMYAFMQQHRLQTGQRADKQLIARNTGLPVHTVQDLQGLTNLCISASTPLHDDSDTVLLDSISDENTLSPPDLAAEQLEAAQQLQAWLGQLNHRERRIVMLKYGIGYRKAFSLDEIAPQMGVTRERVRQILDDAISRLRQLPAATPH